MRERRAWRDGDWASCGRGDGRRPLTVAAAITPRRGDAVDVASFEENARYQTAFGIDGVLVAGTTGENARLTPEERDALLDRAADVLDEDVLIISGVKGEAASEVVRDAERAAAHRADVVLLPPPVPAEGGRDESGVAAHVAEVVAGSPLPVVFYHPPAFRAQPLKPETIEAVRAVGGLAGVKESLGLSEVLDLWLPARSSTFAVFVGNARLFVSRAAEVTGGLLALASVLPGSWRALCDAVGRGEPLDELVAELEEPMRRFEAERLAGLKAMHEEMGLYG